MPGCLCPVRGPRTTWRPCLWGNLCREQALLSLTLEPSRSFLPLPQLPPGSGLQPPAALPSVHSCTSGRSPLSLPALRGVDILARAHSRSTHWPAPGSSLATQTLLVGQGLPAAGGSRMSWVEGLPQPGTGPGCAWWAPWRWWHRPRIVGTEALLQLGEVGVNQDVPGGPLYLPVGWSRVYRAGRGLLQLRGRDLGQDVLGWRPWEVGEGPRICR